MLISDLGHQPERLVSCCFLLFVLTFLFPVIISAILDTGMFYELVPNEPYLFEPMNMGLDYVDDEHTPWFCSALFSVQRGSVYKI